MNKTTKTIIGIIIVAIIIGAGYLLIPKKIKEQTLPNEETIKIGVVLPLSGGTAISYGEFAQRGLKFAIEEINLNGGINGKKLEIIYEDTQGLPSIGIQAINKLIAQNIKIFIGDIVSGVTLTMAPVVEKNNVILVAPGSASPKVSMAGEYVFRTKVSADVESRIAAQFITEKLNAKYVAFLYQNSDYGVGVFSAMKNDLQKTKVKIVGEEQFVIDANDFRTQLIKLKSTNADYVLIAAYPKETGLILKQAKELNLPQKFFAHSGSVGPDVINIGKEKADDLVFLYEINLDLSQPKTKKFVERYRLEYKEDPELFSSLAYDTLFLLKEKLEECLVDTKCIKNSLYKTKNFKGVTGLISFDENGDIIRNTFTLMTIKDGRFVKYEQ